MYALDIVWDPSSEGINIFGKFTIHYYSLMWIAAFTIGHFVMKKIYQKESLSEESLDSLFMYTILGTIIGARLGHVIFYQPELFKQDFLSVFLPFRFNPVFEFTGFRGLASHGAEPPQPGDEYIFFGRPERDKKPMKREKLRAW